MQSKSAIKRSEHPLRVFVSYAHEDESLRDELAKHLSFLQRAGRVDLWHDRRIGPGDDWKGVISDQLELADVILLLLSSAFGASRYCWDVETRRGLERHRAGEARVVPVILRPVMGWQDTPLGDLQALPRDAKPVTTWKPVDAGFADVVNGLKALLIHHTTPFESVTPELFAWTLQLKSPEHDHKQSMLVDIAMRLRELTHDLHLDVVHFSEGHDLLQIRSTKDAYEVVNSKHSTGALSKILQYEVESLGEPIGAIIRIETRATSETITSSIRYLPNVAGANELGSQMPPLLMGVAFNPDNWIQPGFKIGYDPAGGMPHGDMVTELQGRLGRYLNTALVVRPDNLWVSLSPLEDHCGLPEPLRGTELGRDMLAQDAVLKHFTACLLYPATEPGKTFWSRIETMDRTSETLESCMRIWIVPGPITIRESMQGQQAHLDLEKFNLEVKCKTDLETLHKTGNSRRADVTGVSGLEAEVLECFREIILPHIQREVSIGPRFGILRQITSVVLFATWFRKSQLAPALREAGFLDSEETEKFKLQVTGDEVDQLREQYLQMFTQGVWRYGRTEHNVAEGTVKRRVLIAGGVQLGILRVRVLNR